jgi:sigma-B regulation protein RsbU (phosphoserine phosphatase)
MTYQGEKVLFAFQWHEASGWVHIVSRPYSDFTASLATTRNTAISVWVACVFISLVLVLRGVKRITAPVRNLVTSTRRVKEGKLDEQVEVHTRDEIGELGEAFNLMVVGLREREAMRSEQEHMRYELESAKVIQQSFLPADLPGADDPRFSLAALNHQAETVGGDYYDVIPLGPDRVGLVLGDVSGKGIPGAIYMARLVSDFRFLADPHEDSPADTLTHLNSILVARGQQGMFVTLQYVALNLETGVITFANAGHMPMLIRRAGGQVEKVDGVAGPPLGILEDVVYANADVALAPGEDLLMFTDGVTEAMNPAREMFTQERLLEVLRRAPAMPDALVAAVVEEVRVFSAEAPAHDDITLLVARWDGQDPH